MLPMLRDRAVGPGRGRRQPERGRLEVDVVEGGRRCVLLEIGRRRRTVGQKIGTGYVSAISLVVDMQRSVQTTY